LKAFGALSVIEILVTFSSVARVSQWRVWREPPEANGSKALICRRQSLQPPEAMGPEGEAPQRWAIFAIFQ